MCTSFTFILKTLSKELWHPNGKIAYFWTVFLHLLTIFKNDTSGTSHVACVSTWSCCCLASSICCLCFSICEAANFFCSSWAARSCSLRLLSWPIMPMSWRSFSARLSAVPRVNKGGGVKGEIGKVTFKRKKMLGEDEKESFKTGHR